MTSDPDQSIPPGLDDLRWLESLARRLSSDPALADDACQTVWLSTNFSTSEIDRTALARLLRRTLWVMRRSDRRRRDRCPSVPS